MERRVLFRSAEPMPIQSVKASQVEPFADGLLIITTVSVRTHLYGYGTFASRRRNQWEPDHDLVPNPNFLVASIFRASATVEVFHYGKEVRVEKADDVLLINCTEPMEGKFLEPIYIGGKSICISLAGRGVSFKGHPLTSEFYVRLKEAQEARVGQEYSEPELVNRRSFDSLEGLRRAAKQRGRFKKLCHFPKEVVVTVTDTSDS